LTLHLAFNGGYSLHRGKSLISEIFLLANATLTSIAIIFAVTFGLRPLAYSRLMFLYDSILIMLILGLARLIRRIAESQLRQRGVGVTRVLIVGVGDVGLAVMRTMVARADLGYNVIGFVDDDLTRGATDIGRFRALGNLDRIESILTEERIDEAIITLPWMYQRRIANLINVCERRGVRPRAVPDLFQFNLNRVDVDDLGGIPLIGIKEINLSPQARAAKRVIDILATVLIMIPAIPLGAIIALLIRIDSPGPIFFSQTRIGQHGKPFKIIKFRSMKVGAEEEREALKNQNEASGPLFKIKDDPRRTRIGKFIRRTSMDELPQFLNVLRGEMSVIGPRPALPEEVEKYESWQKQRLEVLPGISGLPQISGRSDLTFDEMCLLDIYYIENWSLSLDLTIMARTIPHVLLGRGAY
jgi:exopolysaccharide biosynthesis polyprenyl glycosylphosphotransferase